MLELMSNILDQHTRLRGGMDVHPSSTIQEFEIHPLHLVVLEHIEVSSRAIRQDFPTRNTRTFSFDKP